MRAARPGQWDGHTVRPVPWVPGSGATVEKGSCDERLEANRLIKEGAVPAQRRENESLHSGGAGQGGGKAKHS